MLAALTHSVRYRLMVVILATTLAALLVATGALLTYDVRSYREFLVSDARTQADILARTSAPALQFDDPEAAEENLALLDSSRGTVAAAIYTPEGLFAAYVREGASVSFPPLAPPVGTRFTGGNLELSHPIIANAHLIGTVYLQATYDLAGRVQDYLIILGGVMLLSLVVAGVISLRLQRGVTGPVLAVTDVARRVIENRDFTLRARKTTDDEIGVLVDSFNGMLAEVGRMTEALEATNRRLREETDERRSAEAALRAADRRKDEFLATLAHELRNPLAPMVNALRMIEVPAMEPDAQRARDIIDRQLAHMVRLIDDLLDVSRITRGKLAVHMSRIDLANVVQSAVDTVRPEVDARRHTLDVNLPEEPVYLEGDSVRLSQVLSNLLNNAAKYTEPGGHIALSATVEDGRLELVIADDGIGMSEATLRTIFDMFTQGSTDTADRTQAGLGVGLALAKRLVELHGGTIEASSPGPGRGSRFTVRLGVCAAPPPEPVGPKGDAERSRGQPRRILLVDDNVDFATSLAILLETLGHEVRVAHEADGAVQAAGELEPEIAFLDIGLPVVSGYDLAARLRALPGCAGMVMVALSGWGQDQDRLRSREAGFAAHLVKPVDLDQIETVLTSLVTAR